MLTVQPIPILQDNYVWAVRQGDRAVLIDPGDAPPILAWLDRHRLKVAAILLSHHHLDHTGGVREIVAEHPCPVYGPTAEGIAGVTHPLGDNDTITLAAPALHFRVLSVPGHTRGHLAYLTGRRLFCGDTLFSCGCGRVFEGSPGQMHRSLIRLAELPDETLVCCAHEYTLANISFALTVEPENPALHAWAAEARTLRTAGHPTLPVPLVREKATNPFLRCAEATVREAVRQAGWPAVRIPEEVFRFLREMKNNFN